VVINGYYINGYCEYFIMIIGGYFIDGYWQLFHCKPLVVILLVGIDSYLY